MGWEGWKGAEGGARLEPLLRAEGGGIIPLGRAATMNLGQQTAAARQLKRAVITEQPCWGLGPLLLFPRWPRAARAQRDVARRDVCLCCSPRAERCGHSGGSEGTAWQCHAPLRQCCNGDLGADPTARRCSLLSCCVACFLLQLLMTDLRSVHTQSPAQPLQRNGRTGWGTLHGARVARWHR